MKKVYLYHPKLDRWKAVAETGVSQHEKAGWRHKKNQPPKRNVSSAQSPTGGVSDAAAARPSGEEQQL